MKIIISIAVHNQIETTKACLSSVLPTLPAGKDVAVVVYDNGSNDGTREFFEGMDDRRVYYYRSERNDGFGTAHNFNFHPTGPDDIFVVLNNDTVVRAGWLEGLLAPFCQDPRMGIVGHAGGCTVIDPATGTGRPDNTGRLDYIEASCMAVRASMIPQIGGLFRDQVFRFAYGEDADLSFRARSHGWQIQVVDIPVCHQRGVTAAAVEASGEIDLEGFRLRNRHVLLREWGDYLRNGTLWGKCILVRRSHALGDVILATPVIGAIKAKYPGVTIDVSTGHPEVFDNNPDVRMAKPEYPIQGIEYARVFDLDLAYERRPMKNIVDAYAEECGEIAIADRRPRLYPSPADRMRAEQVLPVVEGDVNRWIGIHPGPCHGWAGRQWPVENFRWLARELKSEGYKIAVVGRHASGFPEADVSLHEFSVLETAAAMARMRVFVGIDSGPLHIAQAMETPSAAIFGSIDPAFRICGNSRLVRAITAPEEKVGCLGCHHWQSAPRTATTTCLRGREICMEWISKEHVRKVVLEMTWK